MDNREKLVCLFYLLMREAVPTGQLARVITDTKDVITDVKDNRSADVEFSNKHLEAMAREYVNRFLSV